MSHEQEELVRMITLTITESHDELKGEIQAVRAELKEEIQAIRAELKEEIQAVRSELKEEIQTVRAELKEDIQAVRAEMNDRFTKVDNGMDYMRDKVRTHDEEIFQFRKFFKTIT